MSCCFIVFGFMKFNFVLNIRVSIAFALVILFNDFSSAQNDSGRYTLTECLKYAMNHQPQIKQALLNEEINKQNIRIALTDWLPQVNATADFTDNTKLPSAYFPDLANPTGPKRLITTGVHYNSGINLTGS